MRAPLVVLACCGLAAQAQAASITWTGAAGGARSWADPGNWSTGTVPGNGDDVTLGAGANAVLFGTDPVTVASLTMLSGAVLSTGGNVGSRSNVVNLAVTGAFDLQSGAQINVAGFGYYGSYPGNPNGTNGFGPGGGGGQRFGAGGGHGGTGGTFIGWWGTPTPGASYDSITDPSDLGSGGGAGIQFWCSAGYANNAGGGAVLISAGSLHLDGTIDASGLPGAFCTFSGGGSGGTINLKTGNLSGQGTLKADGGKGGDDYGPGGGGGRIAISITGSDASALTVSASGGPGWGDGGGKGGSGTIYLQRPGFHGIRLSGGGNDGYNANGKTSFSSALFGSASVTVNALEVDGSTLDFGDIASFTATDFASFPGTNVITGSGTSLGLPGAEVHFGAGTTATFASLVAPAGSLVVIDSASLTLGQAALLGAVSLTGTAVLTQQGSTPLSFGSLDVGLAAKIASGGGSISLDVKGGLTIHSGGAIDVSAKGSEGGDFSSDGSGLGAGRGGPAAGSGAGYGGAGGAASGLAGGSTYGTLTDASARGSGGGGISGVKGGAGGGAIAITVGGTLSNDGAILANGANGATNGGYGAGGGSGGGIQISAGGWAGSGLIAANGGAGGSGSTSPGGGGGGGRIADAHLFPGTVQAQGGPAGGLDADPGQPGTSDDPSIHAPLLASPTFTGVVLPNLTVNWGGGSNPGGTSYLAEISTDPSFASGLALVTVAGTSATFADVASNTVYYARAAALSKGNVATDFVALGSILTPKGSTWIGSSGGDWDDPASWENGAVPTLADPVVIDADVTVFTVAGEAVPAFRSLTLGDKRGAHHPTLLLSTAPAASSGGVSIYSGARLTFNTSDLVTFASLALHTGSTLNHSANAAGRSFLVNLAVTGAMDVQAGASVNASGLGYAGANGPGAGIAVYYGLIGCGAGHGGAGGQLPDWLARYGITCSPGAGQPYDSETNPIELGSGGGNAGRRWEASPGGAGGGAIILTAGSLNVDGSINADGASPGGRYCDFCGGGGSGGTINIQTPALSGKGSLTANGGSTPRYSFIGSAGGGGRIALSIGIDSSSLNVAANGGGGSWRGGGQGEPGTIHIQPLDNIPPTTTPSLSPLPNGNGWEKTDTTLLLTAVDESGGTGVKSITYSFSGALTVAATTVLGDSVSNTVTVEGVSTATFHAQDKAGNVETDQSLTLRIDKTPPTISGARLPLANLYGWNNTDVTVSFTCSDALSGIDVCPGSTTLSAEGRGQSVSGTASDKAGNTASAAVSGINIDKTPPVFSSLQLTPAILWPPNHKMVAVIISGKLADNFVLAPLPLLLQLTSSEPDSSGDTDGQDGYKAPVIRGPLAVAADGSFAVTVQLRAERLGTSAAGRVYGIALTGSDAAGNQSKAQLSATVPHDQRR